MSSRLVSVPSDYHGWELLPEDSDVRCGRCKVGWVTGEKAMDRDHDPGGDRCDRRASWVRRRACNCGQCDMTRHLCSECLVVELMEDLTRKGDTIERAVSMIREYDETFTSRDMVLLKLHGIEQLPPDPPDDYWQRRHADQPETLCRTERMALLLREDLHALSPTYGWRSVEERILFRRAVVRLFKRLRKE